MNSIKSTFSSLVGFLAVVFLIDDSKAQDDDFLGSKYFEVF